MPDDLNDFESTAGPSARAGSGEGDEQEKRVEDLLAMPEDKAAQRVISWWSDQDDLMRSRMAQWRANRARRAGITNVQVIKDRDTKETVVWIPPGPSTSALNKADRLCRRLAATIFSDPPLPIATPATEEDADRDAAEFSTRVLTHLDSEGNLDAPITARQAFDLASTYDSGFRRYIIDPTGNGRRRVKITANEGITHIDQALENAGQLPHVTRLVLEGGQLVTEEAFAEMQRQVPAIKVRQQWLPKIKSEVLSGRHVRFLPKTARDIWCANGVLVGAMTPLGELRAMLPGIEKLEEEKLNELVTHRPHGHRELLPLGQAKFDKGGRSSTTVTDDDLVFTVSCYYLSSPRMPKGAYVVAGGKDILLHRSAWYDEKNDEPLDLPIDQFKQWEDEDEPYGKGAMRILGPGNEVRQASIGALLEHLDRFNNRRVFIPIHSVLQAKELQAATATALPINPGGEPKYEDIPPFPTANQTMLEFVTADMDDDIGLQQTAQGVAVPSVESGLHAQQIIEQVMVGLSDVRANSARALTRGWRIVLQLVRAFYNVPQQVSWLGDDGQHKYRQWVGADLGGTKDVRIQRGSFTSMSPSAKAAVAEHLRALEVISPEELERIAIGNVGGLIGLQDNPYRNRVRRQIEQWFAGPPEGWEPPPPEPDPETGQPIPDPVLAQIFDQLPTDDVPEVAVVRTDELGRAAVGTKFKLKPPEWQQGILAEFERARQASGMQTAEEAAQAAQAQEEAAQAIETEKIEATREKTEKDAASRIEVARITSTGEIEESKIMAEAAKAPKVSVKMDGTEREPATTPTDE